MAIHIWSLALLVVKINIPENSLKNYLSNGGCISSVSHSVPEIMHITNQMKEDKYKVTCYVYDKNKSE